MKNESQPTQLTSEKFSAIAGAFARLQSLGEKNIATGPGDNSAEEKEKLVEYLATELLTYCGEFLACYDLVHREYLPMLRGLQAIAKRAGYYPTVFSKPSQQQVNPQHN